MKTWTPRCAEILRRNAHHSTNAQIAALIQADTGQRFSACTISRYRSAAGLPHPPSTGLCAALRKWRAIEAAA